ncbi:Uncharacterized protein Fot_13277 [Forsythia ovata]|uniref:Uncharacterized protein n=1 Tax=Forsythia ovata TaxID=205694 RepID=A0ABD1W307_9LAMI
MIVLRQLKREEARKPKVDNVRFSNRRHRLGEDVVLRNLTGNGVDIENVLFSFRISDSGYSSPESLKRRSHLDRSREKDPRLVEEAASALASTMIGSLNLQTRLKLLATG